MKSRVSEQCLVIGRWKYGIYSVCQYVILIGHIYQNNALIFKSPIKIMHCYARKHTFKLNFN